jgi:hypothetical protein
VDWFARIFDSVADHGDARNWLYHRSPRWLRRLPQPLDCGALLFASGLGWFLLMAISQHSRATRRILRSSRIIILALGSSGGFAWLSCRLTMHCSEPGGGVAVAIVASRGPGR